MILTVALPTMVITLLITPITIITPAPDPDYGLAYDADSKR